MAVGEKLLELKHVNFYKRVPIAQKNRLLELMRVKDLCVQYGMRYFSGDDFKTMTSMDIWWEDWRENASIESHIIKVKRISDRLATLHHPISNDDLVKFVLVVLGPIYCPFTRSLESHQEEISFDAMLLNEERQLKRDEALTVIVPMTQFTQSSFTTHCGRGKGGRGN
ncbi:hypothetical protein KY284_026484 [Solanum tuberosum]|nr:hypothetical protein KY284_026484 [Solanum tuberosum]